MKKFRENLKDFARSAELKVAAAGAAVTSAMVGFASAATYSGDSATVMTALETGFTGIKTDALTAIGMIVPIALGIAAVIFISRKAISWFKSLAK